MSKIHVIPQGEYRNAEENKPEYIPMDCKGQEADGHQWAEGVLNNNKVKNPFHGLKIIVKNYPTSLSCMRRETTSSEFLLDLGM